MSSIVISGFEGSRATWIRRIVLGLTWAWVGFWTWFVIASHFQEGVALTIEGGTVVLPILAGAVLAHRRPLVAAFVFVAYALVSAWFFHNVWAWAILSAPSLAFGIYFGASSRPRVQ